MSKIFLLLTLLGVIWEGTVTNFPFTIILVTLAAILWEEKAVWWVFRAGILLDLFTLNLLGSHSLVFLAIVFLTNVFHQKIHPAGWFFQLIFLSVILIFYNLLFFRNFLWGQTTVEIALGILLLLLFRKYFPESSERKKLTL